MPSRYSFWTFARSTLQLYGWPIWPIGSLWVVGVICLFLPARYLAHRLCMGVPGSRCIWVIGLPLGVAEILGLYGCWAALMWAIERRKGGQR